jgi:hypothetical protein
MKNPAQTPDQIRIDPRIGIEFTKADGQKTGINCGNWTYREAGANEGGPIILTLLRKADRKDPDNEPFMVISRVIEFKVLDAPIRPEGDQAGV